MFVSEKGSTRHPDGSWKLEVCVRWVWGSPNSRGPVPRLSSPNDPAQDKRESAVWRTRGSKSLCAADTQLVTSWKQWTPQHVLINNNLQVHMWYTLSSLNERSPLRLCDIVSLREAFSFLHSPRSNQYDKLGVHSRRNWHTYSRCVLRHTLAAGKSMLWCSKHTVAVN